MFWILCLVSTGIRIIFLVVRAWIIYLGVSLVLGILGITVLRVRVNIIHVVIHWLLAIIVVIHRVVKHHG